MNKNTLQQAILYSRIVSPINAYTCVKDYMLLLRTARALSTIGAHSCNGTKYTDDKEYDTAVRKAMRKAVDLLVERNLFAYHQTDPRGVSLYISNKKLFSDNYNTEGIAIY
jgi:hypothetical protein